MNKGQKVIIKNTNSIWDGKEGIVEEINDDICTVFVNFIPEEQKRVRQDFSIDNLEESMYNDKELKESQNHELKRRLMEDMSKVIKEIDWNGHHYTFTNEFHQTGTKSHDKLIMEDENGNTWTGETTWINRPWHRFDLEEAFDEIVSKAFGPKALALVQEINKTAHSVEDSIEKFFAQFDPKDISKTEEPMIDTSEEGRRQALANYLDVDVESIEVVGDNEFSVEDDTYKVLTDSEADDEFDDYARMLWEDMGLSGINGWLKDWILENALDDDELEDYVREDISNYVYDMSDEEVADEAIDAGIVSSEEVYDEESDAYSPELRDDVDFDDLREKLIDEKFNDVDNYGEFLRDAGFDDSFFEQFIDEDKVIEAIKDDMDVNGYGRGNLADYDGQEHDLGNGLFAYIID